MPQFHETEMGRRFYERDVPEIADALKKIATNLEIMGTFIDLAFAEKIAIHTKEVTDHWETWLEKDPPF